MFTTEHFIWLGICAVFIAALTIISIKMKFSFKAAASTMAGISVFSELSKIFSHMTPVDEDELAEGMVIEPEALPLHLCSILIFAFFYLPFSTNERAKMFLTGLIVPIGIIGSLLALLMATSGTDFSEPFAYQCFLYHSGMLWFAGYLIRSRSVDLGKRAWLRNICTLLALAFIMIWVNGALSEYNTNFFYVVRPPVEGLPLLNLNNGWYAYFATILVLGFIGVTAVHLPFLLKERKAEKLCRLREAAVKTA